MRTRKVAVTGATGFIGSNLCEYLERRGDDVRPVPRAILRSPGLADSLKATDAVVHVSGVSEAARARTFASVNVEGTRAVARAAAQAGTHVVFISSLAAAGPATAGRPHAEQDPPRPITPYGLSKLRAEYELAASGARWTALRPGPVYGPRDRAFLRLFHYATRGWLPLTGRAAAEYTFIYVDDLVRTIAAAIDRGPVDGPVFVGHPRSIRLSDLVSGIRDNVNPRARIVPVPWVASSIAAAAMHALGAAINRPQPLNRWRYRELAAEGFVCGVDRMRDTLGVVAERDLATGLRLTADWYRKHGWI